VKVTIVIGFIKRIIQRSAKNLHRKHIPEGALKAVLHRSDTQKTVSEKSLFMQSTALGLQTKFIKNTKKKQNMEITKNKRKIVKK